MPRDEGNLRERWQEEQRAVLDGAQAEMQARLKMRVSRAVGSVSEGYRVKFKLPLGTSAAEQEYAAGVIDSVWAEWEDRYRRVASWEQWLLSKELDTSGMTSSEFADYKRRKRAARGEAPETETS